MAETDTKVTAPPKVMEDMTALITLEADTSPFEGLIFRPSRPVRNIDSVAEPHGRDKVL